MYKLYSQYIHAHSQSVSSANAANYLQYVHQLQFTVIASHMLRYMQTIHGIYNTINHTVTVTGQRSIELFTRVYGSDKFHKVTNYLQYVHQRQFSYCIAYVKIHTNYSQYIQHD